MFGRHAGRQQGTFIKKTPFELEKKKKDIIVVKTVSIVFLIPTMKIAILVCYNPTLLHFRLDLMSEMIRLGHQVVAIGNESDGKWDEALRPYGIEYRFVRMQRNGLNPVWDFFSFVQLIRLLKKEKPDRVFTSQAKMVLYGGLAAHCLGIRDVYPLIAGLGSVFLAGGLKGRILKRILICGYRLSLRSAPSVFFQNRDDASFFIGNRIVSSDRIVFLNGSGVNLDQFAKQPFPGTFGFLCVCRILRDKGVLEYLSACRMVKKEHPDIRCLLVGPFDTNPSALKPGELQPYIDDGTVEYFGEQADVRPYLAQCGVFVLPSYREGTPKSVLEAMSCGKAIITTDAPGCRETVTEGENGFLVPVKDDKAVAEKMLFLYENPDVCEQMGAASRRTAEQRFDVRLVNRTILQTMKICS